ncbi:MAG TPA: sigma-70 family RNA polymerase sigma factor [Roseiflexaceae bacterium]|nr:sigma-70 family RNA polymerase sigma factor [Roseiflexaceae bacterium]
MSDTHAAIERLYDAERRSMLVFLRRIVGSPEAAEDLCQDAFLKALCAWPTRDPRASVHAWLYEIARNAAYDYLRGQRYRQSQPLHTLPSSAAAVPWDERIVEAAPVHQALAQIPPGQRVPLVMQACANAPVQDIARRLGCTTGTVHMRLQRGRARFRSAFAALS